jgi:VWFA-related protein
MRRNGHVCRQYIRGNMQRTQAEKETRLHAGGQPRATSAPAHKRHPIAAYLQAAALIAALSHTSSAQTPPNPVPTPARNPASSKPATPPPTPQQEAPALIIHQAVRRVIVDVVVTDPRNRPVLGLKADDFRIFEDGKPQTIRHFDAHSPSESDNPLPRLPELPPHTFMNLPSSPETGPITVILYDLLNTPLDVQLSAHRSILHFLKSNPPTGQTAIFVLSDRLHLLQGFTGDKTQLLAAADSKAAHSQRSTILESPNDVDQAAQSISDAGQGPAGEVAGAGPGKPAPGLNGAADHSNTPSSPEDMLAHAEALEASAMLDLRVDSTLEALNQIAGFLSAVPGRKNLIWLSGSFPVNIAPDPDAAFSGYDLVRSYAEKIKMTGDLLNESQVAVYPVDIRGLTVNPMFDASSRKTYAPGSAGASGIPADVKAVQDYTRQQTAEHSTMDAIGGQTGGHAFYNTNGLEQAMQSAVKDGSSYYSLEYAPTNPEYDGSLRKLKVTLDHRGLQLAYRRSYFADDLETGTRDPQTGKVEKFDPAETAPELGSLLAAMQFGAPPARQLIFAAHVDALGPPAPATADQVRGLIPYLQAASHIAHTKFVIPQAPVQLERYVVQYAVLASQLDLPATKDNIYTPDLTFAVLAFDEDGYTLIGFRTSIQDAIPATRIEEVRKHGYRITQMVYVPLNATSLRIAVRDGRTNRIGSMEVRLPLPAASEATGPASAH